MLSMGKQLNKTRDSLAVTTSTYSRFLTTGQPNRQTKRILRINYGAYLKLGKPEDVTVRYNPYRKRITITAGGPFVVNMYHVYQAVYTPDIVIMEPGIYEPVEGEPGVYEHVDNKHAKR